MAGDAMSLQAGYGLTEHVNKPVLSATSSMVCLNNSKFNFWLPILIWEFNYCISVDKISQSSQSCMHIIAMRIFISSIVIILLGELSSHYVGGGNLANSQDLFHIA